MSNGIKTGLWQEYQREETRRMQEKLNKRQYQHIRDGTLYPDARQRAKTQSMLRAVYAAKRLGKIFFYLAISILGSVGLTVLLNPPLREQIADFLSKLHF